MRLLVRLAERSKAPDLRHVPKVGEVFWSTIVGVVRIPHLTLEINLRFLAFEDNLFVFLGEKKKDIMKVANESMLLLAKLSV